MNDIDGARTLVSRRFMPPQPSDSPFELPSEQFHASNGETSRERPAQETTAQAQPSSSHKQEQDHA